MQTLKIVMFDDEELDPVGHLKVYLHRSAGLRAAEELFVISRRPHSAASKTTLAWLLVDIISSSEQSGAGRSSVRSAGNSKAIAHDISLQSVLDTGEWIRSNTFFWFYLKAEKNYQEAILEF